MKRLFQIIGIMSLVLAASCAQEDVFDPTVSQNTSVDVAVKSGDIKMAALKNYVKLNHPQAASRGVSDELQPIVYLGDTIGYYVNFDEGWELYSNSLTMPILLMKSETGQFDSNLLEDNPSFSAFFELSKKALYNEKNDSLTTNVYSGEWNMYLTSQNTSNTSNSSVVMRLPSPKQTYTVGMCTYLEKTDTVDHLILTKWNQSYPYNEYCPYVNDSVGTNHSLAGCGPVAAAQMLYYSHYNWGSPTSCYTKPYYDESSNTYSFDVGSSTIWDEMPLYTYFNTYPALIIGYAGKEMKTDYGTDSVGQGSSTSVKNFISFLNKEANISITRKAFSSAEAYECLENEKPVPSDIYGTKVESSNQKKAGHMIIFDYCKREQYVNEYYRTELSEDPGYGENPPYMTLDQAELFYGHIYVSREQGITRYFFKANWGWGPYAADPSINGALLEVTSGGYAFDEMYMMIY